MTIHFEKLIKIIIEIAIVKKFTNKTTDPKNFVKDKLRFGILLDQRNDLEKYSLKVSGPTVFTKFSNGDIVLNDTLLFLNDWRIKRSSPDEIL